MIGGTSVIGTLACDRRYNYDLRPFEEGFGLEFRVHAFWHIRIALGCLAHESCLNQVMIECYVLILCVSVTDCKLIRNSSCRGNCVGIAKCYVLIIVCKCDGL